MHEVDAGVDGHRADIVCARTATALAALDGADEVTTEHVKRAAKLALAHRRRRGPLQQPGLDDSELDAAMGESDDHPEQALRELDAELAETIERLQRARDELGELLK